MADGRVQRRINPGLVVDLAAIHIDCLAGQEIAVLRRQEEDRTDHIVTNINVNGLKLSIIAFASKTLSSLDYRVVQTVGAGHKVTARERPGVRYPMTFCSGSTQSRSFLSDRNSSWFRANDAAGSRRASRRTTCGSPERTG